MKKKTFAQQVEQEKDYVAFLKKRLDSANYKANVGVKEYEDTKKKYDKAKFKLKTLLMMK